MYLSPYTVVKKMHATLPAGVAVMFNPLAVARIMATSLSCVPFTAVGVAEEAFVVMLFPRGSVLRSRRYSL